VIQQSGMRASAPGGTAPGQLAALVDSAKAGNAGAYSVLVARFEDTVHAIAIRITRNPEDARDVVQQTWLVLMSKVDTIQSPDALPGWLATTARREALRLVRARDRALPLGPDALCAVKDPSDSPETRAEKHDLDARLHEALEHLPERRRDFLIQLVANRQPYAEVAARFGLSKGSLGPLRARYLRELLDACTRVGAVA
jgi:RNA polymerase sigma factor (sigma-70 family)